MKKIHLGLIVTMGIWTQIMAGAEEASALSRQRGVLERLAKKRTVKPPERFGETTIRPGQPSTGGPGRVFKYKPVGLPVQPTPSQHGAYRQGTMEQYKVQSGGQAPAPVQQPQPHITAPVSLGKVAQPVVPIKKTFKPPLLPVPEPQPVAQPVQSKPNVTARQSLPSGQEIPVAREPVEHISEQQAKPIQQTKIYKVLTKQREASRDRFRANDPKVTQELNKINRLSDDAQRRPALADYERAAGEMIKTGQKRNEVRKQLDRLLAEENLTLAQKTTLSELRKQESTLSNNFDKQHEKMLKNLESANKKAANKKAAEQKKPVPEKPVPAPKLLGTTLKERVLNPFIPQSRLHRQQEAQAQREIQALEELLSAQGNE